jgi:hypothetical protein
VSGQFEGRCVGLSTWSSTVGRLPSWVDCEQKEKNLLRHFGKGSGNLGHGAHTKPRSIGRRELSRFPGPLPPTSTKSVTICSCGHTIDGPSSRRSYHKFRLALPGSSWSFGIRQTNGALAWAGVAENFLPGFDVSGIEAPLLRPGSLGSPHEAPAWRRNRRLPVVSAAARVPHAIHFGIRG